MGANEIAPLAICSRVIATSPVPATPDYESAGVSGHALGAGILASVDERADRPARTVRAHDGYEPQAGGAKCFVGVGRTYGQIAGYLVAT